MIGLTSATDENSVRRGVESDSILQRSRGPSQQKAGC